MTGFIHSENQLVEIEAINGWVSPRLGIRFELTSNSLEIFRPDEQRFLTSVELDRLREQERQRAEDAIAQLEAEKQRYQTLIERLREKGINPEQL